MFKNLYVFYKIFKKKLKLLFLDNRFLKFWLSSPFCYERMFEENKITVKNQKKMKAIFYRVEFKVEAPVFHDKIIF
jgi:hypothetical protein